MKIRLAIVALTVTLSSGLLAETISVDANANRHAIDPRVYGVAFADTTSLNDLNSPLNRSGGNSTSRYNWNVNATNHAADWYFESIPETSSTPGESGDTFITNTKAGNAESMLTIPMLDWVAKVGANRSILSSFSVAKYGAQQQVDPYRNDMGNGVLTNGSNVTGNDPNDAHVASNSTFQKAWVQHLTSTWGLSGAGGLKYYILDNEHSIWQSTHRDVHPIGPKMDEIKTKMLDYSAMVKSVDPGALVIGPEEWGWSGYFYSGYDQQYTSINGYSNFPDRAAHGNMDYLPWLLSQIKQNDTTTGKRSLDVFSVHYYPQGGEYGNDTSTTMQQTRNVSTRSLWDPTYKDATWINDYVQLIPRIKGWVSTYYPGTLTAITEYNWGAEGHINGATTQADIYGIFGREGLDIATRWTTPDPTTPTYKAMKMYRNYDGNKSTFGDTSVKATVTNPDNLSSFASVRSSDGALTVMVINKNLTTSSSVTLSLANFMAGSTAQAWQLTSANAITRLADVSVTTNSVATTVPAQSITLFVIPASAPGTPPAAPTALSATATSTTQINLAWTDNANNESGFKIERKTGAAGTYAQIALVGSNITTYSDTALTPGTQYYYRVRATNASGDSAYSNEANATTQSAPATPAAPSSLAATATSSSQINLTWTDNANNETGFKIERKTGATGTYAQIGTTAANVTTYSDTGLSASTQYYYRVRATNSAGDSGYSNEANAMTQAPATSPPTAPTALNATAASSSLINLGWTDNANNETGFKIERKTGAAGTYAQIGITAASVTTYSDTGLTANTQYYYRIRSTNAAGDSAYSNEVNATTQQASPTSPAAPSALGVGAVTNSQITLNWTDNANNETGFKLERKTGAAGTYAQIATPAANVLTYTDTGLAAGTQYYYRIRATNAAGDSAYSNEANATTSAASSTPPTITSGASAPTSTVTPGQPVTFTVGANGTGLTYTWDFGDGASGSGASATHTYTSIGTYNVVVTVSNSSGGSSTSSTTITVLGSIKINFQPAGSPVPAGYFPDSGAPLGDRGNGFVYGWNADTSSAARDRNSTASPDQRYDTLIHMQKPGNANASWQINLANGTYSVRVVCGDPSFYNSAYRIDVQGTSTVNAVPTSTARWTEGTSTVTVASGNLVVSNSAGAVNNKICFVEISSVAPRDYVAGAADAINFGSMTVGQLAASVSYIQTGHDSISFKAALAGLDSKFIPAGANVTVDAGAAILSFTLNKTGKSRISNGTCSLTFNKSKKQWWIQVTAKGGSWYADWADGGLDKTQKTESMTLPVTVSINGQIFGGGKLVKYSGNSKTGKMR